MIEIFHGSNVDWLGKRKLFLAISGSIMLLGLISLVHKGGFSYGVDFKGGTTGEDPVQPEARYRENPAIAEGKRRAGQPAAREVGTNDVIIDFQGANAEDASAGRAIIFNALNKGFPGQFEILSATSIGPKVGNDLKRQAVFATLYALGGMLIYIAFRFEWIYGAAAVFAVFHDTLVTLGFVLGFQPRNQPDGDRGVVDAGGLFDERHDRRFRPRPGKLETAPAGRVWTRS